MAAKSKSQVGGTKTSVLTVLGTGLFVVLCFLIVFPIFAGLLASFRPGQQLMRNGLSIDLDFSTMSLANYQYIFSFNADSMKYMNAFKNSLFLTFVTVVGTLVVCYFVAYGISMYDFKLRNLLFFLVIATMMVPFEILMLPLYQEIIKLNLTDTTWGVILPGLCGASTIFFFRQYMIGLPKELLEAGRIDGASEYGICVRIMLPIVKPAFASMAILTSMGSWNNLLWPMLVYRSAEKFTLPVYLNGLLTPYGNNYDILIAGSMFSILPVMVVFLCFQSYFIDGMVAGAVKG
ncbi:MAG: carbohydrate ABC transporter permease [Eubacterium sp.]|jgi:arabinosaccharide transport system permease protein|nr:carbohydrate ABC transporter permease [Eubacterium sp.]